MVEWKDGVHIVDTPIWCDASHTREACFVSSAETHDARRHRQIITTDATLALLPESRAGRPKSAALAVPFGRPFNLGNTRVELFSSGVMVGAASLAVDVGERRVVYAGAVDVRGGRMARAADVRAADQLVLAAAFGHPRFAFPPVAETMATIQAWAEAAIAEGKTPVVLAPFATAPDLVVALGASLPLRAHRSFFDVVRKLRALGHALPEARRFAGPPGPGEVVLWPMGIRRAPAIAWV